MADIVKTFILESQRKLNSSERVDDNPETWVNRRVYKREGGVYYIAEGEPISWNRVQWVTEEMMVAADELERQNTELSETDAMPLTLLELSELGLLEEPEPQGDPAVEVEEESSEGDEIETTDR